MGTTVVYASVDTNGQVNSESTTSYALARQGDTLAAVTGSDQDEVGQDWQYSAAKWTCWQYFQGFDVSSITDTIQTATLSLYVTTGGDCSDDQEFSLNVRECDYGGSVTTADWKGGGEIPRSYPLYGSLASSSFAEAAYNAISLTKILPGTLCPDTIYMLLSSSAHEAGETPGYDVGADKKGYVSFYTADYTGTASDPKLTIVSGGNPTDCSISSPAYGTYDDTINLTATATDPGGSNVRYAWDYSVNGGAYSACANSPSGYVASGSAGTITFNLAAVASYNDVVTLRVKAYDGALYSFNYAYVTIARSTQTGALIYRTAGADIMSYPASGITVRRPASAPSSLSFTIDNFDNAEGGIADDDEIVLYVPYHNVGSIGSYMWRGFVRSKRVGDMCEVYCEDVSYRFAKTRVTRTLTGSTVGALVKAIVEDPTGSHATGIVATCDEVEDPLSAGNYLMVDSFDGQGRMLLDWLQELSAWTGCRWYVYYSADDSEWKFVWYDPSQNAAWTVAAKDTIGYESESTSQACILNRPTVTNDRTAYVNRVWFYTDTAYTLDSVETAAVTAATEEPEEILITTAATDATAAESLAQAYLDAYSQTHTTIENLELFGVREVDLDEDLTVTITSSGISAVDYHISAIEYRLLEGGHTTVFELGDPLFTDMSAALERLARKLASLAADVRA